MRPLAAMFVAILFALPLTGCETLSDNLLWPHDASGTNSKKKKEKAKVAAKTVTPDGLAHTRVNPITKEQARKNALARPKIVQVDDLTTGSSTTGNKYFDVVEDGHAASAPIIDENGRAVRAITFSNNAIAKEYALPLTVVWKRAIEAMLTMPLATVDGSSGIITTAWNYDQRANTGLLSSVGVSQGTRTRYKYTVRFQDKGEVTQVLVVPFVNQLAGPGGWRTARPSLMVAKKLFKRIDAEMLLPTPIDLTK